MEIICSTTYDRRALSALARALRKTVRRTRSRLLRVWCWVLLVLSLLSAWVSWGEWGTVALNGAVAVLMLAVLLGEDAINAFIAIEWPRRRFWSHSVPPKSAPCTPPSPAGRSAWQRRR